MGVSVDMFIREIAALVAGFKGIPENTVPSAGLLSTDRSFAVDDLLESVLTVEGSPLRRA